MKLTDKEILKAYLLLHGDIKTSAEANNVLSTLLAEKGSWHHAEDPVDYFLEEIYLTLSACCMVLKKWDGAISYLHEGIVVTFKQWPEYGYGAKKALYHNLAICYVNKLKRKEALEAFRKFIFYEMKTLSNIHYPNFDLYTFRNTKSFALADLKENKISFSSLFDFNDPVDSAYFSCVDHYIDDVTDPVEKMYLDIRREAYSHFRAKCFITSRHLPNMTNHRPSTLDIAPYLNTLMWSHYSAYHNGYCAMYRFPSNMMDVKDSLGYVMKLSEINYVEELQYPNEINFEIGFLTKSKRWEYEHEKRLSYYQLGDTPSHPEVKLQEGCLKEVYIGLRCDSEYAIYEALMDKPGVKVFKMKISNDDIYSLEAEEIDRTTWHPVPPLNTSNTNDCAVKRVWNCSKKSITNDCSGLNN